MDQNSSNLSTSPGTIGNGPRIAVIYPLPQERLAMDQNISNLSTSPGTIGNGPE